MKMTLISPEAARRRSLCDRLEAAFMQEIALLKASRAIWRPPIAKCRCARAEPRAASNCVTQADAPCRKMMAALQVLSESDPEHLLKFHGVCLWDGRLTLVTELMKVCALPRRFSRASHMRAIVFGPSRCGNGIMPHLASYAL